MRVTSVVSVCGMFIAGALLAIADIRCNTRRKTLSIAVPADATGLIGICACAGSMYQAMRKVLFQLSGPGLMLQVSRPRNLRLPSGPVPDLGLRPACLT